MRSILLKVLGTVALAAGFLLLVSRAPFVPTAAEPQKAAPAAGLAARGLPAIDAGNALAARAGSDWHGLEPPFGLFKGRFGPSSDAPAFATEEHRVAGVCAGAGRRWAAEACPTCKPFASEASEGTPALLLWMEQANGANVTRAVTADCAATDPDGTPVVSSITFDDRQPDQNETDPARDTVKSVPLLPGATRTAALQVGDWLATFDRIARPSTALGDMAGALIKRGWREVPAGSRNDLQTFEGERVFTNEASATCVISLTKQSDEHQLLTIISPGQRG